MGLFQKPPPFRIELRGEQPRGMLGGSLSHYVPPGAQYDYRQPSVFARFKLLSALFAMLVLGILIYFLVVPHRPRPMATRPQTSSSDPVYVEPLAPANKP